MVKLKKLKTKREVEDFQKTFNSILGYSTVPLDYFKAGDCFAMYVDKKIVAGFCLVPGFGILRSVMQLPSDTKIYCIRNYPHIVNDLADFTGYFINTKNKLHGILFTMYLVWKCLTYSKNYFIYSYLTTEVRLGKYYASGNPIRIHTGKPEHLQGHHEEMEEEHVEILSKMGIVRIFLYRTKRLLTKWLR